MTLLDSYIKVGNFDMSEMTLHLIYMASYLIRVEFSYLNIRVELHSKNNHNFIRNLWVYSMEGVKCKGLTSQTEVRSLDSNRVTCYVNQMVDE